MRFLFTIISWHSCINKFYRHEFISYDTSITALFCKEQIFSSSYFRIFVMWMYFIIGPLYYETLAWTIEFLCIPVIRRCIYSNRQLTPNYELWDKKFCVPTCFHVRISKSCVCPYPEKRNHPSSVNFSPTLVIDTSMERSSRVLHHGNPKICYASSSLRGSTSSFSLQ